MPNPVPDQSDVRIDGYGRAWRKLADVPGGGVSVASVRGLWQDHVGQREWESWDSATPDEERQS